MTNRNVESSQGDGGAPPPPSACPPEHLQSSSSNKIFKSGPLFLSSRGIGWTSWKKRWFILTRTSLVFFRSDPSATPQKGNEVNLTLGGIDLNNSGSVVVKADKKLLTVLFPDGRDGRAFTLKAETSEDLHEWKTALENALAQAPSAASVMGQNGAFKNDQTDSVDGSLVQTNDKQPMKSTVVGRPVLLALEEVDGTPSFLEKALRFIENHGSKVEGILRQAADVEHVERRIREYEQGKTDFSPEEDPHVIGDCVKYVLRELPSSPVPASCCKALLDACRTERGNRLNAMRTAIYETFPEPNRRLLQRILMMMQIVASRKVENRMSSSAVSACMAPLLLRPLLAGDCEIENDFDVGGDGSVQLLQAAAAANHAQAIVITLLEEYDSIFGEGSVSPELYTDSEESGSEEATDDDDYYDDEDDELDDASQESDADDDIAYSETYTETGDSGSDGLHDDKDDSDDEEEEGEDCRSGSKSPDVGTDLKFPEKLSSRSLEITLHQHETAENRTKIINKSETGNETYSTEPDKLSDVSADPSYGQMPSCQSPSHMKKSLTISNGPPPRRRTVWGRTSAKKNLSMESIDFSAEDGSEVERLEAAKTELQSKIAEEVKDNARLQSDLEKRRKGLIEQRLALEREVARLQEQLQKERHLRSTLEAAIKYPQGPLPDLTGIDEMTKADIEELVQAEADVTNLKQHVRDLRVQLNQQGEPNYGSALDSSKQPGQTPFHQTEMKDKQKITETSSPSHIDKSKNKGSNSTTSALSKLTNRLNFLKERRSQITNEMHSVDKGQEKGKGAEHQQSHGSESHSGQNQNSEKGRGSDNRQSGYTTEKILITEGQSPQIVEKLRKVESHPAHHADKHPQILERARSEGNHSRIADKSHG